MLPSGSVVSPRGRISRYVRPTRYEGRDAQVHARSATRESIECSECREKDCGCIVVDKEGRRLLASSRKSRSAAPSDAPCVRQIGRWVGDGFTGCGFAQSFANSHVLLSDVGANARPKDVDLILIAAEVSQVIEETRGPSRAVRDPPPRDRHDWLHG